MEWQGFVSAAGATAEQEDGEQQEHQELAVCSLPPALQLHQRIFPRCRLSQRSQFLLMVPRAAFLLLARDARYRTPPGKGTTETDARWKHGVKLSAYSCLLEKVGIISSHHLKEVIADRSNLDIPEKQRNTKINQNAAAAVWSHETN